MLGRLQAHVLDIAYLAMHSCSRLLQLKLATEASRLGSSEHDLFRAAAQERILLHAIAKQGERGRGVREKGRWGTPASGAMMPLSSGAMMPLSASCRTR